MRRRPERFATVLLLLFSFFLSTVTVAAQSPNGNWSRLTSVAAGTKLSVKLKSGKTLNGTLNSISDTTMSLQVKNAPVEVKREDVRTVHELRNKSAGKAVLIGAAIGAGAGTALGVIADSNDDDTFFEVKNEVIAGMAVVGAGIGALAGFFVGRSGSKRVLLYESK